MKNMSEAMMVVDCSQVDGKVIMNKEITKSPPREMDCSKMESSEESKQDPATTDSEKNADKENETRMNESQSDSESNQDVKPKKKHRRRHKGGKHHRRWKPYDKMSWSEKQALEEKETRRANQKREEAFASGHPVAPYNTTQFLMDDHCKSEAISPDLHRHNSKDSNASNTSNTSSDYEDENEGFQQKNFMDTFNEVRMQELMNKSKEDLVKEYVDMEMRLERMQDTKRRKMNSGSDSVSSDSSSSSDSNSENSDRLKAENESSKTNCKTSHSKVSDAE